MSKILVVDDEKHIRLLYAEELEEEGYDVATASDGIGILERIEEEERSSGGGFGQNADGEASSPFPTLQGQITSPAPGKADTEQRAVILRERLGIALAPVVGALNLAEVVLSGPTLLLDGPLAEATIDTLRKRTMPEFHGDLTLRMTTLGEDIVMRGAAVMVLSAQLGVS